MRPVTTAPQMGAPGPVAAGSQAQGQSTTDHAIVSHDADICKAESTTSALAATAGCGLYRLASGKWLLTRWGMCRELPDLRSVQALLQQMGVRP